MNTLVQVTHIVKFDAIEVVVANSDTGQKVRQCFKAVQVEDLRSLAGAGIEPYIALAGWTPEHVAAVKKKEEDEAAERKAIADAEEAERKAKRAKEEKDAFDADVARQVAVLEAAKKIVGSKK